MADVEPENETQEETQAPPPEEQEKPTPEEGAEAAPEAEAKPEGEPPAEEGTEAKAEAQQADAEEKRKRAGGWQRKIERLEREKEQAQREKEYLLQQLQSQRPGTASQPASAEPSPEQKAVEFYKQVARQEREEHERQQQEETTRREFQRRTQEVRAANPDFDDVVLSTDLPVSPAVEHALLTSEQGPAIMYQLAKNPGELARISALQPLDAAREIGRLEAKLASVASAPVKPKPATRPPAPPTSVNGSASSTRSLEDLPLAEYKRALRSGRR